jgi:pyruvate dehydrogenase E2 component (dihydrolipoamide acetyltransferase)
VGSVIAIIGEEGDDLSGAAALAEKASSSKPAEPKKEEKAPEAPKSEPAPEPKTPAPAASEAKDSLPKGDRIFASPIAKKIALERGVPLSKIKGTGPDGRIIREDVENWKGAAASAPSASAATSSPAASADYVDTPLSNMRRTIGARLTQSKQEFPHYYVTYEINMDKVLKLREVFNKTLGEKDKSAKLSVNDFIVKATACALADVPEANSAWLGEVIRT